MGRGKDMRKLVITVLIVALMSMLTGCGQQPAKGPSAEGKKIEVKLGAHFAKGHPITDACYVFKDEVEKLTNGRVLVKVFPSMQLGGSREMLEGLQMGNIQMVESTLSPLSGFNKTFLAFNLPYIFPSVETAYKFLDGPYASQLKKSLEPSGFKVLEYWDNGYRQLTNGVRPVRTPEDMKGMKIRLMENPVHMEAFRHMGAQPTAMSFAELFTALQQKTVDGEENSHSNIVAMKFNEVQKYVSDTNHFFDVTGFFANLEWFNKQPADIQEAIVKAARTATVYQRKRAVEDDAKNRAFLKQKMQYTELTAAEREEFKKASAKTYDVFSKEIGAENLAKLIAAIKEADKK